MGQASVANKTARIVRHTASPPLIELCGILWSFWVTPRVPPSTRFNQLSFLLGFCWRKITFAWHLKYQKTLQYTSQSENTFLFLRKLTITFWQNAHFRCVNPRVYFNKFQTLLKPCERFLNIFHVSCICTHLFLVWQLFILRQAVKVRFLGICLAGHNITFLKNVAELFSIIGAYLQASCTTCASLFATHRRHNLLLHIYKDS